MTVTNVSVHVGWQHFSKGNEMIHCPHLWITAWSNREKCNFEMFCHCRLVFTRCTCRPHWTRAISTQHVTGIKSVLRVFTFHHEFAITKKRGGDNRAEKHRNRHKTKNRLMVTDHSKGVPEILPLNRMTKFDFPPHFLVRLMHSFPMMYNTI